MAKNLWHQDDFVPIRTIVSQLYLSVSFYVGLRQVRVTAITGASPSSVTKASTIKMTTAMF